VSISMFNSVFALLNTVGLMVFVGFCLCIGRCFKVVGNCGFSMMPVAVLFDPLRSVVYLDAVVYEVLLGIAPTHLVVL